jgi:hypothetical protein
MPLPELPMRAGGTKEPNKETRLDHNHTEPMLTQLPSEIIVQIIERLPSEDARSIPLVCSALRPHAYRRLFRTIRVFVEEESIIPRYAELVLFYPHLLQYASRFLVWPPGRAPKPVYSREHGEIQAIPVHLLWSHLITMHRLVVVGLHLAPNNYAAVLSALERLDSARHISLYFFQRLQHDTVISGNALPVQSFRLPMNVSGHQLGNQLLHKFSQSLVELRLDLHDASIPIFPVLPHLRIFSLRVTNTTVDQDLGLWLPFFNQHSSLTHVTLDIAVTSVTQVHPTLLPYLQSLAAHPLIIERLIPGRPVHTINVNPIYAYFQTFPIPYDTIFQSFPRSCVPITTLDITVEVLLSTNTLVDMIHSLPMLRVLKLSTGYRVSSRLEDRFLKLTSNSLHLTLGVSSVPLEDANICRIST